MSPEPEVPVPAELTTDDWAVVQQFLPEGWQEQARKCGALRRAPRGVDGPEALLRILLVHLATGCSLAETAVRAREAGIGKLSSVALHKRLQAAEEWLRWLAAEERVLLGQDAPAATRRLRAVDATVVSEPGSTGTDWRIHYAINLMNLQCDFFELTDVTGGETWRRFPIQAGDILLGDRVYANPAGVAHVLEGRGEVVVRLNRSSLPLYEEGGTRLDVLKAAAKLKVAEVLDLSAWVHHGQQHLAGRWIAVRRSAEATRAERERLTRKASKQQRAVSAESWQAAQYIMLWTSLPTATGAEEILEFYRCRWQIELSFKRLKSILGLGHLPKKNPASARAWLHGKLLTSLLVERMIQTAETFSPWGYRLGRPSLPLA